MEELKKETIKKLEELKNHLSYEDKKNYTDMINIMIDYDNEAQDDLYLYDTCNELVEFVDDELLKIYVKQQLDDFGVDRIIIMLQDVNAQRGVYKIDAYGNVYNVDKEDFIYCIDECVTKLKESLEV